MPVMFLAHPDITTLARELGQARVLMRRARRYTAKVESAAGREADSELHRAIIAVERALAVLGKDA